MSYCPCCGRLKTDIQRDLEKQPWVEQSNGSKKRTDGKHEQYMHPKDVAEKFGWDENGPIYSISLTINNCENCGAKLESDDIRTIQEAHEFWGAKCYETLVTGYRCSTCKYEAEF